MKTRVEKLQETMEKMPRDHRYLQNASRHIDLRWLKEKYKISDADMGRLDDGIDHAFEWMLEDYFKNAEALLQIKKAIKQKPSREELVMLIASLQKIMKKLMEQKLNWSDETLSKYSKLNGYGDCEKGDAGAPFYTEAFLYSLLGKEDARTVLYSMETMAEKLGVRN